MEVRPPDVNRSGAKCLIEDGAVRVGLGYVRSVGEEEAEAVAAEQPYADVADLARRAPVNRAALETLVASGACDRFGPRRELLWRAGVVPRPQSVGRRQPPACAAARADRAGAGAPQQTDWEQMLADYGLTGLSIGPHPLELLRPHLPAATLSSRELRGAPGGEVAVAGMAIARQRPATANGVVFMLLEDELGQMNLIVPPPVYEQLPRARPRRAAAPRARPARARWPQPERGRQHAGVARPARPRDRRRWPRCRRPSRGRTTSGIASRSRPLPSSRT